MKVPGSPLTLVTCLLLTATASAEPDTSIGGAVTGEQLTQTVDSPAEQGQKPHIYRMNYWISGSFSLAATVANIYAIPNIIKAKDSLTHAELASLNSDKHNGFDRWRSTRTRQSAMFIIKTLTS